MDELREFDELVSLANCSFIQARQLQTERDKLLEENDRISRELRASKISHAETEEALNHLRIERAEEDMKVSFFLQKLVDASISNDKLTAATKEKIVLTGRVKALESQLQSISSESEGLRKTNQLLLRDSAIAKASFEEEKRELLAIQRLNKTR